MVCGVITPVLVRRSSIEMISCGSRRAHCNDAHAFLIEQLLHPYLAIHPKVQNTLSNDVAKGTSRSVTRLGVSAGLSVTFVCLMWMTGRAGLASYRVANAAKENLIAAADAGVKLGPGDPDAHFVRGASLEAINDLPAAIGEYQKAASLRPDDYVLWLSLARACELNGDRTAAIAAARQAIPLAPYYAQPHWQLGNLLVRAGQRDDGFRELRLAGKSNPKLLPAIIDLAGQLSGGDVQFVKQIIQPDGPESFLALASYFKRHGAVAETIDMLRLAGVSGEQARRQYLEELITAKRFRDAYALWLINHPGNLAGAIVDPGFEQEIVLDERGFAWRSENKSLPLTLSLDSLTPKEGRSSLRVEFNGDSGSGTPIISQLVLIEPNTRYQLRFSYRTDSIVSGGLPDALIIDAHDTKPLGQSGAFEANNEKWRDATIEFTTSDWTEAVQITLARDPCASSPCPIFGRLWLDGFSLQKL